MFSQNGCRLAVLVASCGMLSSPAWSVLIPAVGPGTGTAQIAHQFITKGVPQPAPVFQVPPNYTPGPVIGGSGGGMQSPGANYPGFGPLINQSQTPFGLLANVPITKTTPAAILGPGWNGATSTLVAVAGAGRAGIAVTNSSVSDAGVGTISANMIGASADYINVGGPLLGVRYFHWLSHFGTVDGVGGYLAAGVRSRIQIDLAGGVGPAFNPTLVIQPMDLIVGFDGVAFGNPDFINGADPGLSIFNAVGNTVTFAGIASTAPFNIPAGASVRLSGALTLIGDPADISQIPLPNSLQPALQSLDLGLGFSNDAVNYIPEPATLALVGLALPAMLRRRR